MLKFLEMGVFTICLLMTLVGSSFQLKCFEEGDRGTMTGSKSPYLNVGDDFDLYCTIDPSHKDVILYNWTSASLIISKYPDNVDTSKIEIVNSTTIRLSLTNVEYDVHGGSYNCKAPKPDGKMTGICSKKLYVGYPPQAVLNFRCFSYNWENLTCTWDKPANNIPTKYTLCYALQPNENGKWFCCPGVAKVSTTSCSWTDSTDPKYRAAYDPLYFRMQGENDLVVEPVEVMTKYQFEHFKNMIPKKPNDLNIIGVGSDYIKIEWKIDNILSVFPPGIYHNIRYNSTAKTNWTDLGILEGLETNESILTFNISSLKYPYTEYNIEVRSCSGAAISNESTVHWSEPASLIVETKSAAPQLPPQTSVGCFELINYGHTSRMAYLYWEQIKPYEENGPDFHYNVSVYVNDDYSTLKPSVIKNAYAKFEDLDKNSDYKFFIASENTEGHSKDSSFLQIPVFDLILKPPKAVTTIDYGDGVFELSWKHNADNSAESYTAYWCQDGRDRPYQCNGQLSWKSIPATVTSLNVTLERNKVYQFALSADRNWTSSGMVWASCVILHNQVTGQLKEVWTKGTTANSITLSWRMECSEKIGIILGYKVYYCLTEDEKNCIGERYHETFAKDSSEGTLINLAPFSNYVMSVSVLARAGESQTSDPVYGKTLMAAPSDPPRDLGLKEKGSNYLWLTWSPPLTMNGVLQKYKLKVETPGKYGGITFLDASDTEVKIDNLEAWSLYELSVSACTGVSDSASLLCSEFSKPLEARTEVDIPGPVSVPDVRFSNSTLIMVSWDPPLHPGGPIDHYNVKLNVTSDGKDISRITSTKSEDALVEIPECDLDRDQYFLVSVQAVNINGNTSYSGVWSAVTQQNCSAAGLSIMQIVGIAVGTMLILTLLILIFSILMKKGKEQFDSLKNLKVVLPPAPMDHEKKNLGIIMKETEFLSRNNMLPVIRRSCSDQKEFDTADSGKSSLSSGTSKTLLQGEVQDQVDSGHESLPSSYKAPKKTYENIESFSLDDEAGAGYVKEGIIPGRLISVCPSEVHLENHEMKYSPYTNIDEMDSISPPGTPGKGYSQVDIQDFPPKPIDNSCGYITLKDVNNGYSASSAVPVNPTHNSPYMVVDGWGSPSVSDSQCPILTPKQSNPVVSGYISWNSAVNSSNVQPMPEKEFITIGESESCNV